MKVLVACEESQAVCLAFRQKGHEAYSCDIEPCSGGHPEWHLQTDATSLLHFPWDLIIAFPPCTYMTNAGALHMRVRGKIVSERFEKAMQAKEFFMKFYNADCPRICIENPTPMKLVGLPPYSQVIQPYMFGHEYTKRTCLWLKGLPILMATDLVVPLYPWVNDGSAPGPMKNVRSAKVRSKTFPGVAAAMADQWGRL